MPIIQSGFTHFDSCFDADRFGVGGTGAAGFEERRLTSLTDSIEFPALSAVLPLSEIYRDTGLV